MSIQIGDEVRLIRDLYEPARPASDGHMPAVGAGWTGTVRDILEDGLLRVFDGCNHFQMRTEDVRKGRWERVWRDEPEGRGTTAGGKTGMGAKSVTIEDALRAALRVLDASATAEDMALVGAMLEDPAKALDALVDRPSEADGALRLLAAYMNEAQHPAAIPGIGLNHMVKQAVRVMRHDAAAIDKVREAVR